MDSVAIVGAGDLGATIARRLAAAETARRVVLVDADEGKAKGKALDILQSGPVEGFDTRVEGRASLEGTTADCVILADHAGLDRPSEWLPRLMAASGCLVFAGDTAAPWIEAAVRAGVPRERVLGSAPVAWVAALRRHLAQELAVEPREVAAALLGLWPEPLVLPQGSASAGGVPVERLSAIASRRALLAVKGRRSGAVALAHAAARVVAALSSSRASALSVMALLAGEYGHRGVALAVPARVGAGRLEAIVEVPLDPVDRVALDTAAQRRAVTHGSS